MTEQQKITNWSYPFKPRTAPGAEPTEDVWLYQQALANALGGHYPLGTNGLWHGGVHFDQGTAGLLDQSSVYCIADGEVIAYRIDERYPVSEYESGPKPYSTGFVLVRHRLEVPKPTPATAPQPTTEAPSPSPSLTLFSLYMHLLDWDHYGLEAAPNPPAFISETLYTVKPDKATDPTLGLRVRATPGNGTVLALLPKGTRVEVGDTHPGSVKWRRLINVIEGSALPSLAGCDSGWVFTGEMESTPAPNVFLVGEHANDHEPNLAPQRGLNIRKTGRGNASDAKTGLLPEGTHVTLEPGTTPYRKIKAIIEGTALPPLAANSVQNIQGYVHFDSLQATRTTPVCGAVHLLDPPYPIKAGELIGHPGHYQNHNDGAPQTLLHLEVFSCDDVPAFIAQSRALAAALPAEQKTQLKIHKGASKLIPHREGIDANHPPSITDAGTTIGVDLIIPLSTLERLPPSHKITVNTATNPGPVTHWWRLDNLLADNDGNPISGWLAEQDLITTRHSPWEWEGFECVEYTEPSRSGFSYYLNACNQLNDKEKTDNKAAIEQAEQAPLRSRLHEIIDSNRDGKLTRIEIRTALKKPWLSQPISQLITKHTSEWFWDPLRWNGLDDLMRLTTNYPNQDWTEEKKKIEISSWWERAPGKLSLDVSGVIWSFHATRLLNQIKSGSRCYCFEQGVVGSPCSQGLKDVSKDHFESLATQLDIEREVLRAIAIAETGDKAPFKEFVEGVQHAKILYERHYMRRLLLKKGYPSDLIEQLSIDDPEIVHSYQPNYQYGTESVQYERLLRARNINEDAANMSCSWGKFQVMGEHYKHLYKTSQEMVEAQNYCALQHLQYFKIFLIKEKNMLAPMKNKNWISIAEKYNGLSQVGYNTKIEQAYDKLKGKW
ncbi:N-acetylmuramidase domain-containing protein [Pseudomonas kuykendallii]|uniref:N-acetylmuramidase domain-containing protein n=1 Tax=Pseudomonas kuykendallii TaxID=1007099 RepID=A0A2W5CSX5_9PSED|nr:N-acetylmuramidase domain-containing protein [Pseudomonas kuykendallii]PZP22341.1 MAG: hypothetical protein DI599_16220 [Pseudomonas kuykendallii]